MEVVGEIGGVTVYDDFAHHPTAIKTTLEGLRRRVGQQRIIAVIEPRSNTMRLGVHKANLTASTAQADQVLWYQPPGVGWEMDSVVSASEVPAELYSSVDDIVQKLVSGVRSGDHIVIMSNGGFGGIHQKLVQAL